MNPPPDKNHPPQPPVKVVIIEDETWIRENLVQVINRTPGLRCVNHYRSAEEALQGIPADQPDIALVDINLPGMDGVECVRRLQSSLPDVKCLMLTVYEESEKIFNSLLAGARGYLLKRAGTAELLNAIQQLQEGGAPMSSNIARKVVGYFHKIGNEKSDIPMLTSREEQVLEMLAKGVAYKNIADRLSLSVDTIRMNVKHIYAKLHVHSRGEAAAKYLLKPKFHRANDD